MGQYRFKSGANIQIITNYELRITNFSSNSHHFKDMHIRKSTLIDCRRPRSRRQWGVVMALGVILAGVRAGREAADSGVE
jgi:hypothetical protein